MRLFKILLPYALVAMGAIAAFAAGAYSSAYFAGMIFNHRLGEQELAQLASDHIVLQLLDSGNANQARALLVLREDGQILGLHALAPYLPDPSALSACRLLRAVATHRIAHPVNANQTGAQESADVRNMVAAVLRNPVACRRTK